MIVEQFGELQRWQRREDAGRGVGAGSEATPETRCPAKTCSTWLLSVHRTRAPEQPCLGEAALALSARAGHTLPCALLQQKVMGKGLPGCFLGPSEGAG